MWSRRRVWKQAGSGRPAIETAGNSTLAPHLSWRADTGPCSCQCPKRSHIDLDTHHNILILTIYLRLVLTLTFMMSNIYFDGMRELWYIFGQTRLSPSYISSSLNQGLQCGTLLVGKLSRPTLSANFLGKLSGQTFLGGNFSPI